MQCQTCDRPLQNDAVDAATDTPHRTSSMIEFLFCVPFFLSLSSKERTGDRFSAFILFAGRVLGACVPLATSNRVKKDFSAKNSETFSNN